MLTEWAPLLTVLGVLAAALIGLFGVLYSQRKAAERDRESWRREQVYEVAKEVLKLVSDTLHRGTFSARPDLFSVLNTQFKLLHSLIDDFHLIDDTDALRRYESLDGNWTLQRGVLIEVEALMVTVVYELHGNYLTKWERLKRPFTSRADLLAESRR